MGRPAAQQTLSLKRHTGYVSNVAFQRQRHAARRRRSGPDGEGVGRPDRAGGLLPQWAHRDVAFSPDGPRLAAGSGVKVRMLGPSTPIGRNPAQPRVEEASQQPLGLRPGVTSDPMLPREPKGFAFRPETRSRSNRSHPGLSLRVGVVERGEGS